ncbi:MAG: hypothetical protein RBT72_07765 [Spirochaetia bacterium]|jgi:hypothetical protein|nr:hypothetical protein [Spirochaetia bacterium]
MKKFFAVVLVVLMSIPVMAQGNAVDLILKAKDTILTFDANASQPSRQEIETMLQAAIKAPSGRNTQRYWYTVITDYETQKELALTPETKPTKGTVLFILSVLTQGGSDVDIGITYGYLALAAEALGYGSHIYGQPASALAKMPNVAKYGVPAAYTPKEFILVGKPSRVDGTSAATSGQRAKNWNFLSK